MATSYALPLNGSANHSHGHGHTRSHHRKAVPDRLTLAPASLNSMLQVGPNGTAGHALSRPHTHSRSLPQGSWSEKPSEKHQYSRSTLEASQESFDMNSRQVNLEAPKALANSSYGLPPLETQMKHSHRYVLIKSRCPSFDANSLSGP
jgi:hypothetical protein